MPREILAGFMNDDSLRQLEREDQLAKKITHHVVHGGLSRNEITEIQRDIKELDPIVQQRLDFEISTNLLMDDWQVIGPTIEKAPQGFGVAFAAGVAEGVVHYNLTGNPYAAIGSGLATSAFTLFGLAQYSKGQTKKMYDDRAERANDFLKMIPGQ